MGVTTKLKIGIAATLLVAGGGAAIIFDKPALNGIDNRFGEVTAAETVVQSTVRFANPNPVALRIGELMVSYTLEMNGITLAQGKKRGVEIQEGNNSVDLETVIDNEEIPRWWASHVDRGEQTTVAITADLSYGDLDLTRFIGRPTVTREIETDLLSRLTIDEEKPLRYEGETVLVLRSIDSAWADVTQGETTIITDVTLYNPRSVDIPLTQLNYEAAMNNVTVATGKTTDLAVIPARQEETVTVHTTLNNEKLDEWWVTHLNRAEYTQLELTFDAAIEALNEEITFNLCTYRRGFYTDFLDSRANRTGSSTTTCMNDARSTGSLDSGDAVNDTVNNLTTENDTVLNDSDTENDSDDLNLLS